MTAVIFEAPFNFLKGAVTSRGTLTKKIHYFIRLTDNNNTVGWGECAPIAGLTPESDDEVRNELIAMARCWQNDDFCITNITCSAVRFAFETAIGGMENHSAGIFFKHDISFSIKVNGLVWINNPEVMCSEAMKLIDSGFTCVKMKIDGKNRGNCISVIKQLRRVFNPEDVQIRLDANGSFPVDVAMDILEEIAPFGIESIEQPIASGNWTLLSQICQSSPVPIALDEELIRLDRADDRTELLLSVKPAALVLKPSLHGGFSSCDDWIRRCDAHGINWWCTSYLESNLGLSALAQWLSRRDNGARHGLGTGKLYRDNFMIPAILEGGSFIWNGRFEPSVETFPGMTKIW